MSSRSRALTYAAEERMRIAGLPVWALVLAVCVLVPFAVQAWVDAERRRAKERTHALLQTLDARLASGPRRAASEEKNGVE